MVFKFKDHYYWCISQKVYHGIYVFVRSSVNVKYVNWILVYRHKEYCRYVWQSCRTSKTASSPPNAVRICSENSIMIFLSFLDTQLASFGFYYQQNFSFVKGVFLKKNEKRVQAERHGFRNRKSWNPGKYKCERGSSVPEAGSHARLPFFIIISAEKNLLSLKNKKYTVI